MNNEIMTINREDLAAPSLLDALNNPGSKTFCSIVDDGSRASKVKIYNAVANAEEQLLDHVNEVLEIVDVIAHEIALPDMNTGEVVKVVRTVLIDKNGKGYQAVSQGVLSSLSRIFQIVGMPSWIDEPVKMKPKQVSTTKGFKVLTIELIA